MMPEQQHACIRILLADDDVDDRFLFDKALNEIPVTTLLTIVRDGEELMNYLDDNLDDLPDLIFLDLSMPRKTGFECLCEIKENEKLKHLRVILFSTSFSHDLTYHEVLSNTLLSLGAEDFIRKPDDFSQLKKVIHNALNSHIEKRPIDGFLGNA